MNEVPLIAFTDSEMKYGECFKSTAPILICIVMDTFLWEFEMIPHELFERDAMELLGSRILGIGGLIKAIVCKFPAGVNLPGSV